jgi:hypothetical protein
MDPESGIQIMQAYQDLLALAPLIFEGKGRKFWIECCLEVLEDNMDCALCSSLGEVARCCSLGGPV